jgi:hypothetical protein
MPTGFLYPSRLAICILTLLLGGASLTSSAPTSTCRAAIVMGFSESRSLAGEQFETDLVLSATTDQIGDEIEGINLDIVQSTINGQPLTEFGRVRFDATPTFAPWFDGAQFGEISGGESQLLLNTFATDAAEPFPITDTDPFLVGTFRFDYSGLGLTAGDTATLNLLGEDDGSGTRTTSILLRRNGETTSQFVNPAFNLPGGSESRSFMITAIPEPDALFLILVGIGVCRLPRRSHHRAI